MDINALGIPAMEDYIHRYCMRRGLSSVPDMEFYIGFAQFRYAAMIQGILKRSKDGINSSRQMLHRQDRVTEIAAMARRTLSQG